MNDTKMMMRYNNELDPYVFIIDIQYTVYCSIETYINNKKLNLDMKVRGQKRPHFDKAVRSYRNFCFFFSFLSLPTCYCYIYG